MNRKSSVRKLLALLLFLAAFMLLLTACYVPADDKSSDTGYVQTTGQVFQTIAPSATPSPVPTPTPTPIVITPTPVPPAWQTANPGGSGTFVSPTATPDSSAFVPATTRPPIITNPPDVVGATATPYSGVAANTPAPTVGTLKSGASGSEVRALQQRLKDLGFYSGKVDGKFGAGTEQAVKAFQKASGLKADGAAGSKTMAALNAHSAVRVTATPKVTATPRPTSTPRTNLYLSLGSKSDHVKTLQKRLMELGYLSGVASNSYNGPTEYAVKAFQKRAGLWDDGTAGPETLSTLYSSTAPKAKQLAATTGESLYEGENGDAVRAMQRRLKELGYLSGSVDGSYGSATTNAVRTFQTANGLTADGVAGTATLNRLYASNAAPYSGSSAASSSAAQSGSSSLEQNNSGSEVRRLQNRLKELGFYKGKVDGNFGPETVTAVMNFQKSRNLTVDGKVGSATMTALYSTSYSVSYTLLKEGSSGNDVKTLQYTLYELGYYKNSVDGKYGASTSAAVKAFQARNGLSVTGLADSRTQEVLYSSKAKAAPSSSSSGSTFATLRLGDSGEDVMEMKDVLLQLGYKPTSGTDVFDAKTEQAVREFQERNGLAADGVAGRDTLEALYSESAIGK